MKATEEFKRNIKAHLDQMAKEDELFASSYAKPHKSLDECVNYILNEVKKSGCNGFADDEIYGMAVHHCVYSNGYYDPARHKNSLILSAKDRDGNRIETVEVNLKSLRVVQCRGKHNKPTKKHKQIIDLVNNNMGLIKKAI